MKTLRYLVYVIVGMVILGMIWFFVISDRLMEEGSGVRNTEVVAEESGIDQAVFPLYEGPMWGKMAVIEDENGRKVWRVVSGTISDVENIHEVTGPFAEYYDQKLTTAGWERDIMREASGPGSNVSYYVKGDRFITIAYESDFKVRPENAPFECPCDIRFSITSGTE